MNKRTRTVHEKHDISSQDLSRATRKSRAMKEYHERSTWSCVCVCLCVCLFDGCTAQMERMLLGSA